MKKHFLKSFALLAMLFSAITMSAATKYCGEQVQSTIDNTNVSIGVTILKVDNALRVSFESEHISGIRAGGTFQQWGNGVWANQPDAVANFKDGWTQNGTIWTKDFAFSTYPTSGTGKIYCLFDIVNAGTPPVAGFTLTDIDLFATCDETPGEGGEEPEPEPETPSVVYCDFPTGHEGNATFGDPDGRILVSVIKKSETTVRLVVKSADAATKNLDLLYVEATGANPHATTVGSDVAESDLREMSVDITYPTAPAKYNFMIQWSHPNWTGRWQTNLNDITVEQLCTEGGDEPEPTPDPTITPGYSAGAGADYTYVYTNDAEGNVRLWVTFNEALVGVAGPLFFTENNEQVSATTTDNKVFFASVSGKKDGDKVQLRAYIPRAGGVTQTPLLSHTVGTESGLIVTEYCYYTNELLTKNGAAIALTWETADNGDVVITMDNGIGAESCSYRNGGFEGGIEAFVVSTDNFVTTTPASDYFTFEKVFSGNEARLVNIADLEKGAKIMHIGSGHALAWTVNGNNEYCFPDFIYTYGGVCNKLEAPSNVAVTDAGVVTFDEVLDATSYEVRVYQGVTLKYTQEITNGGTINFEAYVAGEYTVKVVAKAIDKGDSLESDGVTWNVAASPLPMSNYCESLADAVTANNGSCSPYFSWVTDAAGNVVITVSASEGDEGATTFRGTGMNGAFSLDGSVDNFNTYFNRGKTDDYTYTLTLKDAANKPALGSVISFSGQIEAKSSVHTNDYSNYVFDGYLYGTKCLGQKHVTAAVDDAARGTATVNGQADVFVDENTEVTFIATANAGYVFVNWTKGNEVVSTSPTYTTTITSALTLRANFDYERIAYCHHEVLATAGAAAGKKLYLTIGSNGTGKYYIKFEGSAEAPLASLNNANYIVNGVSTDILVDGVTSSGQDVPFTKANGRWSFDAAGYGSAMMEFSLAEGKTISDIFVWTNFIAFGLVGGGELIYEDNQDRNKLFGNPAPLRYNIDWNNVCIDDEAPVLVAPQAKALNATDVQLTMKATDNWDGLITYNISYHPTSDASSPVKVSTTGASAEEITYDILALTTGVEYTFTITVSDGTNTSAAQTCVVTPATSTTTTVENTQVEVQSQKTLLNGVLYIIRNGVTYDVMGRVVR